MDNKTLAGIDHIGDLRAFVRVADACNFTLAAERLGVAAADCLVFEDAEAGIAAGEAAGCDVRIVTAP